jgi:TPR repeat protein
MYENGRGCKQNYKKAKKCLELGMKYVDFAWSQNKLGEMYVNG